MSTDVPAARAGSGALSTNGRLEGPRVHRDLEQLLAVDGHDRDPHPVLQLEGVVAGDVDLLEGEVGTLPDPLDHVARLVAEPAAGARIQRHTGAHGGDGTSSACRNTTARISSFIDGSRRETWGRSR